MMITSLVTQSYLEENVNPVIVPTTGTSLLRVTVTLSLVSVSSVCLRLRVSTVRDVLRDTLEMLSTITVRSAPVTCWALIQRGLHVTETLASVTVCPMLLETTVMSVLRIIGTLQVERVVKHVPVIQLVSQYDFLFEVLK